MYEKLTAPHYLSHPIFPVKLVRAANKDFLLGYAAAYSSVIPDLENTDSNQDWLAEETKNEIISWFSGTGLDYGEGEITDNATSGYYEYYDYFNPNIDKLLRDARDNDEVEEICELAEVNKTDLWCDAIYAQDLQGQVKNTKNQINLCWAKEDEIFSYTYHVEALCDEGEEKNKKIRTITIPSTLSGGSTGFTSVHAVSGGFCLAFYGLGFLTKRNEFMNFN